MRAPIVTPGGDRGGIEREEGGPIPQLEAHPLSNAERFERKRNSGGGWHVSRLSVFTEIPCTLRPITFVTDYSTKVSHRARARRRKLTPINYTARIVNAVKWSPRHDDDSSNRKRACGFYSRESLYTCHYTNFAFLLGLI